MNLHITYKSQSIARNTVILLKEKHVGLSEVKQPFLESWTICWRSTQWRLVVSLSTMEGLYYNDDHPIFNVFQEPSIVDMLNAVVLNSHTKLTDIHVYCISRILIYRDKIALLLLYSCKCKLSTETIALHHYIIKSLPL